MKRVLLTVAIGLLACVSIRADEPTLDSLKQTYETEVQKIRDAHAVKEKKLLEAYGRSAEKAVEILKKQGDPDEVLHAIAEKKRFEGERTVPAEPDAKLPRLMQDVQASYLKAVYKADVEKARAIAHLTPNYITALERLMKSLTAQEKLDLALNVKAEKERVVFILADLQTELKGHDARSPEVTPLDTKRSRLPKDAVEWNRHYYLYYPGHFAWGEAQDRCVKMGGHLVTIESPLELRFIKSIADGHDDKEELSVWVGAQAKKGEWVWVDGQQSSTLYGGRKKAGDFLAYHRRDGLFGIRKNGKGASGDWIVHGYVCEWDD